MKRSCTECLDLYARIDNLECQLEMAHQSVRWTCNLCWALFALWMLTMVVVVGVR